MAKATKTFKIGECCKGGIITVEITGKIIVIIGKEWGTSKEFTRGTIASNDFDAFRKIDNFLHDLTTSYYAGKVIEWIRTKVMI